jgi:tetratricopeptide (TPR) repeat protein
MEKLKKSIISNIKKGNLQSAFDLLENINISTQNGKLVVALESAFNNLGHEKIANKLNTEDYYIELSKIRSSFIIACELLEVGDFLPIEKEKIPEIPQNDTPLSNHEAHYLIQKAKNYRKYKNYPKAIEYLTEAARQQPRSIAIQTDLAINYRLVGNIKEALNILDELLDKRPHDVFIVNELANVQRENGRFRSALEILDRGLKLQPDNNHLHTNKFFIHLFFTCKKEEALNIRDNYEQNFGKKLIQTVHLQKLYNDFLIHFEALQKGEAERFLLQSYIDECQKKRAFETAKRLRHL